MKTLNKYLFLCGFTVSYLFANADKISCTAVAPEDPGNQIKVNWQIIWPSKYNEEIKPVATVNASETKDPKNTRSVNVTHVLLERIKQDKDYYRVTRLVKASKRLNGIGPLNIIENDKKKEYLSVTYLERLEQSVKEIWMFNGYIGKTLYTNLKLTCNPSAVWDFYAPNGNNDELSEVSVEVLNSFMRKRLSDKFFKVVWLDGSGQVFTGKLSKGDYSSVAYTGEFNFIDDTPINYYKGSYMTDSRMKDGVDSNLPARARSRITGE